MANIIIHHLRRGQSERIIWLCEELGLPYELHCHDREPTLLGPTKLKSLSPTKQAPVVIVDDGKALAESAAVFEYIINKHDGKRLTVGPDADSSEYADYLFWYHVANGSMQPLMLLNMTTAAAGLAPDNPLVAIWLQRTADLLKVLDERLEKNEYLCGRFTAADIFNVFSLTTMRTFVPLDLTPYPNIVRWLGTIGKREAYQTAMRKGDPDMKPLLEAKVPQP